MQNNRENELILAIIEKKLREEAQTQQLQNSENPFDRISGISNRVENFGEGLSNTGNFLSNHFSSLGKLGNGMQSAGNALQTGANTVKNVIPTSSNLTNTLASKIGSSIGGASAGTAAGTSAATGVAGASAAPVAGTAAGASATGSAAAGGSAASGAATAGPIGALVALGAMALQGTNRKRAKQTGQQAQQLADAQVEIAKNRLAQTEQTAEILGNQNKMQHNNYLTQFGGDTKSLIDSYIQSSMPEQSPISNAINSYVNNSSPAMDTQQTGEEMKQGIFNKLANGLGDFINGYKENRTQGFTPENLQADEAKGTMQRIGEGFGTAARLAHNPIMQGVIAGGLSTALTGNPLYGLGMAHKFTNNRMNSDLYKNVLEQQGVDTSISNGTISSSDLSRLLVAKKFQNNFLTRKDYDRMRLENGLISIDEYNETLSNPDYNPDEMVNLAGLNSVAKAGRYAQENKNDRSKNYYRSKNDGKNVIKVEYGDRPDTHNYTHVTYGAKPEQKNTTHVTYGDRPQSNNGTNNTKRIKVKSPDGKIGSIPASQLGEAVKKGYKKI